jgi:hypothetical protein
MSTFASQHPPISHKDLADAQAAFDANDCGHWRVTATGSTQDDSTHYYRAERPTSNSKAEVIHEDASVLLRLAQDADRRLGHPKAVAVADGTADSTNY